MKKVNTLKAVVMASALLVAPLSFADVNTPSDSEIVSAIQSKIAADKTTSDLHVQVSSNNGVVTLSGKVHTDAEADKLVQIAESIQGVQDVDSKLTDQKSKSFTNDSMITAKVKGMYVREKLYGDKDISVTGIKVITTNGTVYLTGNVDNQDQADNAVKLAKSVKGVKNVESKLVVQPSN